MSQPPKPSSASFEKPASFLLHYLYHIGVILPFSVGLGLISHHFWIVVLISIIVGILIDLDHFVDYFLEVPFSEWKLSDAIAGTQLPSAKRVLVIFHGYDIALFIGFCIFIFCDELLGITVALVMIVHIATDQFEYNGHPLRYIFLFRCLKGFPNSIFVHRQSEIQ
jgi:hypothetical protein